MAETDKDAQIKLPDTYKLLDNNKVAAECQQIEKTKSKCKNDIRVKSKRSIEQGTIKSNSEGTKIVNKSKCSSKSLLIKGRSSDNLPKSKCLKLQQQRTESFLKNKTDLKSVLPNYLKNINEVRKCYKLSMAYNEKQ